MKTAIYMRVATSDQVDSEDWKIQEKHWRQYVEGAEKETQKNGPFLLRNEKSRKIGEFVLK